jgi:cyclopropane-fatty-acyl-phospholipid synthase
VEPSTEAAVDPSVPQIRSPNERGRRNWPLVPAAPTSRMKAVVASWTVPWLASRVPIRIFRSDTTARSKMPSNIPALSIHRPTAFYNRLATGGLIGFGESYQAGDWDADDLAALLTELFSCSDGLLPSGARKLRRYFGARRPANEENTMDGARQNISYHYDLSNEFFAQFLDQTMTYSAALFPTDTTGRPIAKIDMLREAQARKIDRLLDLARVGQGTRLLEIGTGWGELSIRAARRGAYVHTVTLSAEQAAFTERRIREAEVPDRVLLEIRDYRELGRDAEKYDAIISIEMIEAIGEKYWPTYFSILDRLLAKGGRIGLQVITMRHDRFLVARHTQSWVNKYILPGFLLPSARAMEASIRRHSGLQVVEKETFGPHYAATLHLWRERFVDHADEIDQLGFNEAFRRTWLFFLASCEAGFRAKHFDVYHYILDRSHASGS